MDQGGGDDDDADDADDDDNADYNDAANDGGNEDDDGQVAATRMRVLQMIHPDWNVKKAQVVPFFFFEKQACSLIRRLTIMVAL